MRNLSLVKNLGGGLFIALCFVLFSVNVKAQSIIVNYDFASASVTGTTPCTVTPKSTAGSVMATLTTSTGTCTAFATGRATVVPPAFVVNAANQAISITNAVTQQYYQFQLSGSGLSNTSNYMVFFQTSRSNTGPPNGVLQYSTDGTNFTDFATFTVPTAFDDGLAFNLSSIGALNNQTNIYFRVAASGASGPAGTFRLDNFQVKATQPQATLFSGEAVGVIANANIGGTVTADARVADTGPLPTAGGSLSGSVLTGFVALDASPSSNSRITTGVVTVMTSGGTSGGTPNSSQSSSTVNDLAVRLLVNDPTPRAGATITATTVQSTSNCTCGSNGPTCSGTTTIENLQINGVVIPILDANGMVTSMPPPNTVLLPEITGVLGLTIILNEQKSTGSGDITVNAIHIMFTDPITGSTADIIVAQSHSDISCLGTTAAGAIVAGRITDSRGRGLQRVVVMMTGGALEEPIYATTSAFGYYRFEDVPAGNTYILTASSIRYTFDQSSIVLNVSGDFAGADFVGQRRFLTITESTKAVKQQ